MNLKSILLLLFTIALISCGDKENTKPGNKIDAGPREGPKQVAAQNRDCIESFKKFRDDIYHRRKEKVQNYFSFPITDTEIWYAVQDDNFNNSKDFTEKDFYTYYNQLFPKEFVQSLLKVKSQELFEKGYFETPKLSKQEGSFEVKNYVIAQYDKVSRELILSYSYEYYEDGNKTESATIYYFTIDGNCSIKFKKLMMAG